MLARNGPKENMPEKPRHATRDGAVPAVVSYFNSCLFHLCDGQLPLSRGGGAMLSGPKSTNLLRSDRQKASYNNTTIYRLRHGQQGANHVEYIYLTLPVKRKYSRCISLATPLDGLTANAPLLGCGVNSPVEGSNSALQTKRNHSRSRPPASTPGSPTNCT